MPGFQCLVLNRLMSGSLQLTQTRLLSYRLVDAATVSCRNRVNGYPHLIHAGCGDGDLDSAL
jgi:hypothetical protein